jgi:hypothetical protein
MNPTKIEISNGQDFGSWQLRFGVCALLVDDILVTATSAFNTPLHFELALLCRAPFFAGCVSLV